MYCKLANIHGSLMFGKLFKKNFSYFCKMVIAVHLLRIGNTKHSLHFLLIIIINLIEIRTAKFCYSECNRVKIVTC